MSRAPLLSRFARPTPCWTERSARSTRMAIPLLTVAGERRRHLHARSLRPARARLPSPCSPSRSPRGGTTRTGRRQRRRHRSRRSSTTGKRFSRRRASRNSEGVVAKQVASPYRPGRRSPDWQRLKLRRSAGVCQSPGIRAGRGAEPEGSARSSPGAGRGCAALGGQCRHRVLRRRDQAPAQAARSTRAARLAVRRGSEDAASAVPTSPGSSPRSSRRSSSWSGRTKDACARPRMSHFVRIEPLPMFVENACRCRR